MLRSSSHRQWSCPSTSPSRGSARRARTQRPATPSLSSSTSPRRHLSPISRALNRDDDCPFDTLGVSPSATDDEIKRAYRSRAKEHHPDVASDGERAAARFLKIAEAYKLLTGKSKGSRPPSPSSASSSSSPWSFHDFFWSFSAQRRSSWAARKARQRAGGVFESYDGEEESDGEGEGFPRASAAARSELKAQLDALKVRAARRRAADSAGATASAARAAAGKRKDPEGKPSASSPRSFFVAEGAAPGDSSICDVVSDVGGSESDDGHHGHHRGGGPRRGSFVGDADATRRQLAGLRRKVALRRASASARRGGSGGGGGGEQQDDD